MQATVPRRPGGSAYDGPVQVIMPSFLDISASDPSQPQQRTMAIHRAMRHRICTNRYPPGKMLSEEALAREFEVSRSPIRRVLARLEQEGLIEILHGVGSRVTRISPEMLASAYDARMAIAVASAPFMRINDPDAILAALADAKQQFRALAAGDVGGFADVNTAYYDALTELISNHVLREILRSLFFQTSRTWLMGLPRMDWALTIDRICWELDELRRALDVRDAEAVGLLMRNHVFESRRRLVEALDSSD